MTSQRDQRYCLQVTEQSPSQVLAPPSETALVLSSSSHVKGPTRLQLQQKAVNTGLNMLHGGLHGHHGKGRKQQQPSGGFRVDVCLCVGDQGAVTFSQASWTFTAAPIINSVPTETSLGWVGQYPSLRSRADTLVLPSSCGRLGWST